MEVEFGRDPFRTPQKKEYFSAISDSEAARGMEIQYSVDGGPFKTLGQINGYMDLFSFKQKDLVKEGRDINYKVVHNAISDPPTFNGFDPYLSVVEATPDGSG